MPLWLCCCETWIPSIECGVRGRVAQRGGRALRDSRPFSKQGPVVLSAYIMPAGFKKKNSGLPRKESKNLISQDSNTKESKGMSPSQKYPEYV